MKILFLYHRYCRDGFAAAAVSFKYYMQQYENNLIYNLDIIYKSLDPGQIENSIDILVKNYPSDTVVISYDLAFTFNAFKKLVSHFEHVDIWDHHITTKEKCIDVVNELIQKGEMKYDDPLIERIKSVHFVLEHCGAVLAWKNYFPNDPIPLFLLYIQDRDLWINTQENSEIINAGLFETLPLEYLNRNEIYEHISKKKGITFSKFNIIQSVDELNIPYFLNWIEYMENDNKVISNEIKTKGTLILNLKNRAVAQICRTANLHIIREHKVYVVNATDQYISDVCNVLYEREVEKIKENDENENVEKEEKEKKYSCNYVMAWRFNHQTNLVYVSLRSRQNTGTNVANIAYQLSENGKGGGHRHAAGFECTMEHFNKVIGFFKVLTEEDLLTKYQEGRNSVLTRAFDTIY